MLRFLTAGESHGPVLTAILEGLPAGLELDFAALDRELARRQHGYGRGPRMRIETDRARLVGGVRDGRTTGGPLCLQIDNRDWENWKRRLSAYPEENTEPLEPLVRPRPGHADLAGALKYETDDFRDILERSSARETAARVAMGAVAKQFLVHFDCRIASHVTGIGSVRPDETAAPVPWERIVAIADDAPLRCADPERERRMMEEIDRATAERDSVGGVVEIVAHVPPAGLGSFVQWDRRLDGRLAQALMSIPAVKAVGLGAGVEAAFARGSALHDEIVPDGAGGLRRTANRAGGLEGGVTNGEELRASLYMKPLSSLRRPLRSVDIRTGEPVEAARVRSDVCAVPAAGVVGEAMVALVLAAAGLEKFGGDRLEHTVEAYRRHRERVERLARAGRRDRPSSAAPATPTP